MSNADDRIRRPAGTFNAEKCVRYLRYIGADVTDEMASSWDLSERVHRFLKSQRKTVRECGIAFCANGHSWHAVTHQGRLTKAKRDANEQSAHCFDCGLPWTSWRLEWSESREGAITDWRERSERWKPLPPHTTEAPE